MKKIEMKDFSPIGIIRQLDDLGRVSIPKDLRVRSDFRAGDQFEIFADETSRYILLVPMKRADLGDDEK